MLPDGTRQLFFAQTFDPWMLPTTGGVATVSCSQLTSTPTQLPSGYTRTAMPYCFDCRKTFTGADGYYLQIGPTGFNVDFSACLLYTSPSPRDGLLSRMPSSA